MPFNVDNILLKSFIAVAETGSFSRAGDIVGRSQSAVSLQIKKLEEGLHCELFDRSNRDIRLTEKGEVFLGYARRMIELQWEAYSKINEPEVKGVINLGTPEDFATHYLPNILSSFSKYHPHVQLHVKCDLTLNIVDDFDKGLLDIALVKRDAESVKGGVRVWKEPLIWAAAEQYQMKDTIQLVLSPQPCIYRGRALNALERVRKPCEITYISPSLAGTIAAVKAGMGITVLPLNMLPEGVVPLASKYRLPKLNDSEIALLKRDRISDAGKVLAAHIVHSLEKSAYN